MATSGPADPAGENPSQGNPAQENPPQQDPRQDDPVGERPRTPWAARFGVHSAGRWRTENSSGLHPDCPNIDPENYVDLPPEAEADPVVALEMPDDAALDKLFLDEADQRSRLCGLPMYQAVVFNDNMPVEDGLRERVNESSWHPVFQKARWYNMDLPLEHEYPNPGRLLPGLLPNPTYNVDDPVFWAALQPAIQLASDILTISFNLPFNDAVRSVRRGQNLWRGVRPTGMVDPPHIADNPREGQETSRQEKYDWLMYNSKRVQISFMAPKVGYAKMGSAVTYPAPSKLGAIVMLINPSLIWVLLDSAATPAQRAHCAFAMGTRLAHEMQHAAYRMEQLTLPGPQRMLNEAFYRPARGQPPEWVPELGMAFERQVVGGFCRPGSGADDVLRQGFLTACEDFPNRHIAHNRGGVNVAEHSNDPFHSYLTPASLIVDYFKTGFWENMVPKYKIQAVRLPRTVRVADMGFGKGYGNMEFSGKEPLRQRRGAMELLRSGMETRGEKWERLRPWHRRNFEAWQASFWALSSARNALARFTTAALQEDEYEAQEAIKDVSLNAHSQWPDAVRYGSLLGDAGDGFGWLRDALGFLMFAALPSRREERVAEVGPGPNWTPGRENLREVQAMGMPPFPIETQGSFDASQVLRTRHPGGNARGNRVALLETLEREFKAGRDSVSRVVPKSILSEFRKQVEALKQWASKNRNSEGVWGPFNFKLPDWTPPFREKKAAKRRRRLLTLRKHQPSPASLASSLLSHLVSHRGSHRGNHRGNHCRSYRSNQVVDDQVEEDHLNNHLLNKAADKQEEGSLRTGGIPHGEVEAVKVKVGKTTTGRIALRGLGQALSLPEYGPSLPGGDEGMEAVVEGPVEEVGVVAGDVEEEEGAAAEEGVVMEDRALDRVVVAAADELYTVGEVGDHRSADDLWLLVDAEDGGYDVYDATDLGDERVRNLIRSSGGRVPAQELAALDGVNVDDVFDSITQDICAKLAETVHAQGPEPSAEMLFTEKELGCYIYPEEGIYTNIRGDVYDMTDFMDSHPGGRNMLKAWAGRELTEEFARYHRNADQCIEDYDYLRIGRMVEETTPDQLTDYEVALNGLVYDLRPLWEWEDLPENHPIFTEGVGDGYGTDISQRLRVPQPPRGLLQLLDRRDLIVAKLSRVVDVYLDELAENDGSEVPPEEGDGGSAAAQRPAPVPGRRPAWVSCEGEVYDMTSVWKHGPAYMRAWIDQWKGKQVPPSDFTQRLAQDYGCRIFGRLMWGFETRPPNLKRPADDVGGDGGDDTFDPDRDDGRIKRGRIDWNGLAIVCE
ncbi:hypothetical protein LA080_007047 [Diaporthe eres]|nr:hypothetical protein LA080_007047 [Diaporthe eres]